MGRRPRPGADFEAIRTAIGTALRSIHSHVLNEPLPERIAELLSELDRQLRQLDEPKGAADM
jgi:Anti-sigma factor NepR